MLVYPSFPPSKNVEKKGCPFNTKSLLKKTGFITYSARYRRRNSRKTTSKGHPSMEIRSGTLDFQQNQVNLSVYAYVHI